MSHRSRWTSGLVTVTLALSGLLQAGLAAPASAAPAGPCSYDGAGSISLEGSPAVGAPVTATVVGRPGQARFTWSGTGFGESEHGATFTARPDVVGAPVRLDVQVRDGGGRTFRATCDLDRVGWGSLARPAAPVVAGAPVAGGTLHASAGAGTVLPDGARVHYEWFVGDDPSAFATGDELVLHRAQVGSTITVKTFVTAAGRRDSAWSAATVTDVVAGDAIAQPGAPSISGTPVMAGTLEAAPAAGDDVPEGATYEFRWFADGAQFATGDHVTLAAEQVGHAITVADRASAAGYAASAWSTESAATVAVAPGVLEKPTDVTISGTPVVGSTLTAVTTGAWTAGTEVLFTWKADDVPFANTPGAVVLTNAEVGRMISVEITGSLAGYGTETIGSPVVGPVDGGTLPELATPSKVTVSGTPQVGRAVTARVSGSWPAGTSVVYVWRANGRPFAGNASTVVLTPSQRGARITVTLTGSLPGYRPGRIVSAPSATVAPGRLKTVRPRVQGRPRVGRTLTARHGHWTNGTSFSYRWYADGRLIKGATGKRLRLTGALAHHRITVRVTGRKSGYTPVTLTSRATPRIR
jgi:hypothetical protein